MPTSWQSFHDALEQLGRKPADVAAVVLTHAHFDHLGFAEKARSELGVPVYVHENDVPLTRHPWRYDHERPRSWYFATQVRALPMVAAFVRNRAWFPPPVKETRATRTDRCRYPGRRAWCSARATRWAIARCTSPTATRSSRATRS